MAAPNTRNVLILGVFVAFGLAAGAAMIMIFKGSSLLEKTYQVYSLWDNIGGMLRGNPVLLAGHQIGKIRAINPPHTGDPRAEGKVEVVLEIYDQYPVYDFQPLRVIAIGMIGDKYVDFGLRVTRDTFNRVQTDGGEPGRETFSDEERRRILVRCLHDERDPPALPRADKDRRAAARAALEKRLGGTEELDQVRAALVPDEKDALNQILDRINGPGIQVELVLAALGPEGLERHDLRQKWLKAVADQGNRPVPQYPDPLPGTFPPSLSDVVDELSPKLNRILDDLHVTFTSLNENYLNSRDFKGKIESTLDKAGASLDKLGSAADEAKDLVARVKEPGGTIDKLDETLTRAGTTMDEAKDKIRTVGERADKVLAGADDSVRSLKTSLDHLGEITRKIDAGEGSLGLLVNKADFHNKATEFIDTTKATVDNVNRFVLMLTDNPSCLIWGKKTKRPATLRAVETDWRERHE